MALIRPVLADVQYGVSTLANAFVRQITMGSTMPLVGMESASSLTVAFANGSSKLHNSFSDAMSLAFDSNFYRANYCTN